MSQSHGRSSKFETPEYLRNMLGSSFVHSSSLTSSTTSTVLRRISPASAAMQNNVSDTSDVLVPNPVIERIILDYTLSIKNSDEKARPAAPLTGGWGERKLVETMYNWVEQKRLNDFKEASIAILSGVEPDEVMRRIEQHPEILLMTADEKQCMGISGLSNHCAAPTLYRTALATGDTQMAEKIKTKLIEVAGKEEAKVQYDAQFPEGWEKAEEKRWKPIFDQMERVIQAIRQSALSDITSSGAPDYKASVREKSEVARALAYFRLLLDGTRRETAMTGRHFNDRLLQQAFQIYNKHFHDYFGNNWDHPRALLWWQQGIGIDGIQPYLPINYMQAFCNGLEATTNNLIAGCPQGRALRFDRYDFGRGNWVSTDVYPLQSSRGISGFCIYGPAAGLSRWGLRLGSGEPALFEAYFNQKQQLYRPTPRPEPRRTESRGSCVLM